jgi:hypothetical protein
MDFERSASKLGYEIQEWIKSMKISFVLPDINSAVRTLDLRR